MTSIVERALGKLQEEAGSPKPTRLLASAVATRPPTTVALKQPAVALPGVEELCRHGLAPHPDAAPLVAEEFRRAKRPLMANAFADNVPRAPGSNVLMVVGATPGVGKSFVAFNLALSVAEGIDHSTVLVDGDVTKRKITVALGMQDKPGLTDLLLKGDLAAEDVIVPTSVPGLAILPSGSAYRGASELFASRRMFELSARLSALEPGRLVIFDAPPALTTNEAQALVEHMGQYIVVVEHCKTPRRAVHNIVELLDQTKPISLLLNKAVAVFGGSGTYSYHYGSSY